MNRHDSPFHDDQKHDAGMTAPRFRSPERIVQHIRERIEDVADKQERLSKAREDLLTKRESTRASSKRLRAKRSEAGDAEAAFMDYIRDFMHTTTTTSPKMVELFNNVETTRNELGAMEEDHQQLERSLTGADWMLKEDEDEFYQYGLSEIFENILESSEDVQDFAPAIPAASSWSPPFPPPHYVPATSRKILPEAGPLPSPPSIYVLGDVDTAPVVWTPYPESGQPTPSLAPPLPQVVEPVMENSERRNSELDGLGKQFGLVSLPPSTPAEMRDTTNSNSFSPLEHGSTSGFHASTMSPPGTFSQDSGPAWPSEANTANDDYLTLHGSLHGRRRSAPAVHRTPISAPTQLLARSGSDDAVSGLHRGRAAKTRVRDWLMKLLKENPLEKTLYRTILEATLERHGYRYPESETWSEPATHFWGRDSRSSFETDPLDRSTVDLDTVQDSNATELPKVIVGEFPRTLSGASSLYKVDVQSMTLLPPVDIDHHEDEELTPTMIPLPPSPNIRCIRVSTSAHREISVLEPNKVLRRSRSSLPVITIAPPAESEGIDLSHAAASTLSPPFRNLSHDLPTWHQYRFDLNQSPPCTETAQHVSCRNLIRDIIFPSRRRRSHSMSSTARPRGQLYELKRTQSKDKI